MDDGSAAASLKRLIIDFIHYAPNEGSKRNYDGKGF